MDNKNLLSDPRIVLTLDAGGTTSVFGAMRGAEEIVKPITMPSQSRDLSACLAMLFDGFETIRGSCPEAPVAISFAFPGPADYLHGIIGRLENMPAFQEPVPLGPLLEEHFGIPAFINNDGDLFTYGEAIAGLLPEVNRALEAAGSLKRFRNLFGITLGTGFGAGLACDGRMFLGDNGSGASIWCTRNKLFPSCTAEEGVSIRAVRRVYAEEAGISFDVSPEPKVIRSIALGETKGDMAAAREAFRRLGEVAGDALANANAIVDALLVVGGGVSGAADLILPAMVKEMNTPLRTLSGKDLCHGETMVYNYEDSEERARFLGGDDHQLCVPGTTHHVPCDMRKRTALGLTRLGTSRATSVGAYAFALSELDRR